MPCFDPTAMYQAIYRLANRSCGELVCKTALQAKQRGVPFGAYDQVDDDTFVRFGVRLPTCACTRCSLQMLGIAMAFMISRDSRKEAAAFDIFQRLCR
jgi:hypothetical protein